MRCRPGVALRGIQRGQRRPAAAAPRSIAGRSFRVQAQCRQDLVVAGTPEMQARCRLRRYCSREAGFEGRMHILVFARPISHFAGGMSSRPARPVRWRWQSASASADQLRCAASMLGVGLRSGHVVGNQAAHPGDDPRLLCSAGSMLVQRCHLYPITWTLGLSLFRCREIVRRRSQPECSRTLIGKNFQQVNCPATVWEIT